MKIALTGGSGDIGGAYLRHVAKNHQMHALVRAGSSLKEFPELPAIQTYTNTDGIHYNATLMHDFTKTDAIVHFAALLNAKYTLEEYIAVNALLTGLIAMTAAKQNTAPHFVYISSEMVYQLPNDKKLTQLSDAFVSFCKKVFLDQEATIFDLHALARQFLAELKAFPFTAYNGYALTKYLGEKIVQSLPKSTVVRITNAYGPGYDNLRLIPKLIVNRLTGHNTTYGIEKRDFVYNADIHSLIDTAIDKKIFGTIDCKSDEVISTDELKELIIHLTPTAYGVLSRVAGGKKYHPTSPLTPAQTTLRNVLGKAMPFHDGLTHTLRYHKEKCYHEMADTHALNEFVRPDEKFVRNLHGSSAAYTFVVEDASVKKVRKVAIRDGVEGNGIAKVKNEIQYYKYIAKYHKKLAKLYPKLLDSETNGTFSAETIEYLDGNNFYETLQQNRLPSHKYQASLEKFVEALCSSALDTCKLRKDGEDALNAYYIERSLSRLQPIKHLIPFQDTITINNKLLHSPHVILNELLESGALREFIKPRIETFCFHGDMTVLNTVYLEETNEIRLIDPRGHIGLWDPLYDFGKLKLALDGFGELIFGEKTLVSKDKNGYIIAFDQIPEPARYLSDKFYEILENNKKFSKKIIAYEPYWYLRISFTHATHYLADIPFRLYTDNTEWTAIASYVLGTYYLNDVYDKLRQ